jgi:hypothetical protein
VQLQNDAFQPGIGNTNIASPTLPRSGFDGLVQTTFGNLALTMQPLPKLDVRLACKIDNRDNQSPRNLYLDYPVSAANTSFSYDNLPFSYEHQIVTAEASHRILTQTKVTLNGTLDSTYRTYANASPVTSNRITAKVAARCSLANVAGGNAEPANLVMSFDASRKHDEVKALLDASPTDNVGASLVVKFSNGTDPDGTYGLRNNSRRRSAHTPITATSRSFMTRAACTRAAPHRRSIPAQRAPATSCSESATTTDSVHTFGANLDWQAIEDVLKFSRDYKFAYGDTAYAFGEGVVAFSGAITSPTFAPSVNMQPLPDVKSMLSAMQRAWRVQFPARHDPAVRLRLGVVHL